MDFVSNAGTYAGTVETDLDELVERATGGDEEAFGLIFGRYASPVFSFIYRMVGQRELAEELTQETFARAYRKLGGLRLHAGVKLSTWLFSIARNVSRESARSRRREGLQVELDAATGLSQAGPQPDDLLLSKELNRAVQEALAGLDEDKRLVFVLRVIHQHSYEEIAEITGFSLQKLKSDLFRARERMRRVLSPYLETGHGM